VTVIVSGTLHVDPEQRNEYLEARIPMLDYVRASPGCIDFSLTADLLDDGRINVYERWRSREDLLAYRASDAPGPDGTIEVISADVELHHVSSSEPP
jgi:quinol monooxygenase YgiN